MNTVITVPVGTYDEMKTDFQLLQEFMDEELNAIKNLHERIVARNAWIAASQKLNQVHIDRLLSQYDKQKLNAVKR